MWRYCRFIYDKSVLFWFFLKVYLKLVAGLPKNKLKSLKVAQVKDEMDDDEDGCDSVCDVVW